MTLCETKLSLTGQSFVQSINRAGYKLEDLFDLFIDLNELQHTACRTATTGAITTSTIDQLGKAFIDNPNPNVAEVIDLIEASRKGQFIVPGSEPAPNYDTIQKRWNQWILQQPGVWKYIDHACTSGRYCNACNTKSLSSVGTNSINV